MGRKIWIPTLIFMAGAILPEVVCAQSSDQHDDTLQSQIAAATKNPDAPVTTGERWRWFGVSSFGTRHLALTAVSAGWSTMRDTPPEYGTHWEGFGDRYGLSIADTTVSNGLEAGIGSLWGEDPRYHRMSEGSMTGRLGHVVKATFVARDGDSKERPAYARFAAVTATPFISNTYRVAGDDAPGNAAGRIASRLLWRMAGNAFSEFWPDLRNRFHHQKQDDLDAALTAAYR